MIRPQNPLEVEMIINACVRADYEPPQSGAHSEALDRLVRADMVKVVTGYVFGTDRAKFWLKHICNVPYPVESYSIPAEAK